LNPGADPQELNTDAGWRIEQSRLSLDPWLLSKWVQSPARYFFDKAIVVAVLPLLLPVLAVLALLVRLTSPGPALFRQKRVGRHGALFTILKFRTMACSSMRRGAITTTADPAITRVGRFLRFWKLDELPQFLNVLRGDMSLVGPRPKVPGQQTEVFHCRPGITGAATIAFANEESFLAEIPEERLEEYFQNTLLPLKRSLDAHYMAHATPITDLQLLAQTALRNWPRMDNRHPLPSGEGAEHRVTTAFEPELRLGD
jgi:lipopolysaccharide/colanic/teichoic acid biosynthesis glycosyltransferase